MLEVENARKKLHEYQNAKLKASLTNPYVMMSENNLVDKILAEEKDVKRIYETHRNRDLSEKDRETVENAQENYCLFKEPYYKQSFEHTLLRLRQID